MGWRGGEGREEQMSSCAARLGKGGCNAVGWGCKRRVWWSAWRGERSGGGARGRRDDGRSGRGWNGLEGETTTVCLRYDLVQVVRTSRSTGTEKQGSTRSAGERNADHLLPL